MDWKAEATRVIQAFDVALGRPPFPQDPTEELVEKATAVHRTLNQVISEGKLKVLEGVAEVTTTLPILCASLKEGSPDRRPCLALYRPVLLAVGLASSLSTYPISHIVVDAKAVLGAALYGDAPQTGASSTNADDGADIAALNEAALFTFMATARGLTPEDMRRFLRLPLLGTRAAPAGKHNSSNPKSKGNGKGVAMLSSKDAPRAGPAATSAAATATGTPSGVSRAVLEVMIDAPLADDCRHVFESFIDNTQKFLDVVGCDGDLANRILKVYAERIVPKLKLSSLLPCLNAELLDYYVDVVASSLREGPSTLLISKELREIPLKLWDADRVHHLACAAAARSIRPEEAMPSLFVYTFLYAIYCASTGASAAASPSSTAAAEVEQPKPQDPSTEYKFVVAVLRATNAVLPAANSDKHAASPLQTYAQRNTGIVVIHGADVPGWWTPLSHFAQLLLSREAAMTLSTKGLTAEGGGEVAEEEVGLQSMELMALALRSLLVAVTKVAPVTDRVASPSTAPPPPQQHKANAGKLKGAKARSATGAPGKADVKVVQDAPPPVPISELLSSCCSILLFMFLYQRSTKASSAVRVSSRLHRREFGLLVEVLRSYAFLLQHQPQRLSAALWHNCLNLLTYSLWMPTECNPLSGQEDVNAPPSEAGNALPLDGLTGVLASATSSTDSMLWLAPLVLSSNVAKSTAQAPVDVARLLSANAELWLAVVQAAVGARKLPSQLASVLCQQLFPAPPAYVLGALCSALDETVLQTLADHIVTAAPSRSAVLVAGLQQMDHDTNFGEVFSAVKSAFLRDCVPACVAQNGLRRLLSVVAIWQAGLLAIEQAAEAEAKESARRGVQEQLRQTRELAAAHRSFQAEAQSKHDAKAAKQRAVQAEVARRRAQQAARFIEDAAVRARKRANAQETLKQMAEQSRARREAARRERFAAYQQRLQSEYRVATFLEHLNLSSARVMETRDALRKVIDKITPDDLLEFLVSGEAKVPSDMVEEVEGGDEEDEEDETAAVRAAAAPGTALVTPASVSSEVPRCTGERRDFWAEIMDHAVPADSVVLSRVLPVAATTADAAPPAPPTAYRQWSFHKRVTPLLDLFFYEDGDEYGKVPEVLPTLRLRVASGVWPSAKTQTLGFANLREAFDRMRQRGLVQMRDGVVQLTLLGFRYHFPFHDPDGMLEVHLREARERVRALVAHRHAAAEEGNDEANESEEEEWNDDEGFADEEDAEDGDSAGRLLPEVEFGI
ncbi:hypothetical protein ABB37_02956 [Leptomonas pyrrhocoris]|uniref:Uncharacterized protein n=1 Tax=Leptomonas pyrrhocoris TaxID=157538 RepID=A0A0M9G6I7_LEPPY|nr:hypothetical protein ABB37_02956 [Leptomonas pyrrhocoris]XP_015661728.1 hypothetical protein ABB37_02956 [Leptomonas pyrrhocoris]KPA83288.1 hypothetical protein ABB37_02956 [Leptomonas pyrrhocoris]KPA83289.1 hypothetical protein ABB37_02956 [Leptomonas pyrrhocoris]|eukprot:XP_015661727.1 hypothetical protein ABB37_02956 [Leptomonas pyrrhocoris]